jgi:hypothetical protein
MSIPDLPVRGIFDGTCRWASDWCETWSLSTGWKFKEFGLGIVNLPSNFADFVTLFMCHVLCQTFNLSDPRSMRAQMISEAKFSSLFWSPERFSAAFFRNWQKVIRGLLSMISKIFCAVLV